ncbi:MAG: Lrp/AsnC ligand binding domain-containing protein [Candidatus Bathyarchaeota archaeon]|nr:Lrp/AsnC ligand binding domain-containing protein [Candidatus Bathyarchaeum tardum]WNZ29609.1 MAG: Lrp/AsnC ligand binding domain-containing protein [Candidatus Bathyarchaeota archaeon]
MAVLAYVLVTLNPGSEKNILEKVADFEEVTQVNMTYGEYDALVLVTADTLSQLNDFLTEKLRVLPDIFQTATLIVAKTHQSKK